MPSKSAIINAALHHIKQAESQTPLTDGNEWVARIRNRYDEKVRLLFEKHPWNFCSETSQLAATEPTPSGWTYGFNKPPKCWRIIKVGSCEEQMAPDRGSIMYEDRGGRICSDHEETWLKFVDGAWLTAEGSWPQVFADALAAELAHAVGPVTDTAEITDEKLERKAGKFFRIAKNWDAQQQPSWPTGPSSWQVARNNRSSRRYAENG